MASVKNSDFDKEQEVRAKDLPRVCDELGVLPLDEVDNVAPARRPDDTGGGNAPTGAGSVQQGVGTANTPPLPIFPAWWSPEAEKELEAIASAQTACGLCVNGLEEETSEYGATVAYGHQPVAHQPVNIVEGYGGQQGVLHHDGVIEFVDANGDASHSGFHSPSTAVDQQLHVSVDQYPVTVVYPSVVSSPSNDQTLASCATDATFVENQDGEAAKWAPPSPGASLDLSLEELKTRVRHQLEYYFSRENLAADAYLRSQMDNDQFVKVTTLASFNMVKRLTIDLNLILEAIRESPVLQVNETGDKVRPIHKRCTLILREIPEGTKKEEVEQLFSAPQCPKIVSSEIALHNIWYVNFETDEDAQKAFLYLRQKVQCFKGKPILARIKTAPIPRVQHNGSRPAVPNMLPIQNIPYPAISPSPNMVSGTSQMLLSPSDSCTLANASTPFSASSSLAAGYAPPPVDNSNAVTDSSVNVPTSPMCYYHSGHLQPMGATATPVGPVPVPMSTSPWPSPDPGNFDLGGILAMNGFQPQGAYRPAVFLPTPAVSPACQIGTATGQRFTGNRQPRKPRGGMAYTGNQQQGDRAGAQSADSGRPPPSYGRYGTASGARSANAGYHADRRGSQYWNYDSIHYDSIRRRPNRYFNNNFVGFGNGMNGFNVPNEPRPRYPPRGDRQGRYSGGYDHNWNNGNYQPRPFRRSSAVMPASTAATTSVVTTACTVAAQGKRAEDSFDLQLSSFPPLPTAAAGSSAEPDKETNAASLEQTEQGNVSGLEPTHILQREYREQTSAISSSSPVVTEMKSPSTVPTTDLDDKAIIVDATRSPEERSGTDRPCGAPTTAKQCLPTIRADKKAEYEVTFPAATHKTISGFSASKGGNTLIPVAVVQPNAQQKSPKVTTADKSTTTDLSPPPSRAMIGVEEGRPTKLEVIDDECNQEENAASETGKKLSYADMAKHAAGRGSIMLFGTNTVPAQKTAVPTISANVAVGSTKGKDQTGSYRQHAEKDRDKCAASRDGDPDEDNTDQFWQHRRLRNKYDSSMRKYSRPLGCTVEGQHDQGGEASHVPRSSY